ncbi:GL25654 [Drosophila persimilis]|uniref:GL25654 n=1 Tax=Drosophila persimilis TaxID=7234 RepID=B4GKN5_DROPE|nr:GL25654 [Drosophila persimilis]
MVRMPAAATCACHAIAAKNITSITQRSTRLDHKNDDDDDDDEDEDEAEDVVDDAYDCECDLVEDPQSIGGRAGQGRRHKAQKRRLGLSLGREQYEIQCHICCMN